MAQVQPQQARPTRTCASCGKDMAEFGVLYECTESRCSRKGKRICSDCTVKRSALAAMKAEPDQGDRLSSVPDWLCAALFAGVALSLVALLVMKYFLEWDIPYFRAVVWATIIVAVVIFAVFRRQIGEVFGDFDILPLIGIRNIYHAVNKPLERNTTIRAGWDVPRPCCTKCGNIVSQVDQ